LKAGASNIVSRSLPLGSTASLAVRQLPDRSSRSLHCISLAPARLDRYLRGFTGHVAPPIRSIGLAFKRAATFDNILRRKPWQRNFTFHEMSIFERLRKE
jgi:hypothetical protein